jgi:hypothetical protein
MEMSNEKLLFIIWGQPNYQNIMSERSLAS